MKKIYILLIILLILAVCTGAWWRFGLRGAGQNKYSGKIEDINVRLKWLHQTQFAGHYVADKKGFYKDVGVNVNLKPFDFVNWPIDEVVSGKADFGVTGADELLIARAEGKPIKALAVIYQENPVTTYALASSGIDSPDDFVGKRVGIQTGVNVEFQVRAMLAAMGIDYDSDIITVPIGFDVNEILEGKVDVGSGYITNEPILIEEKGEKVNIIHPKKYRVNLYADVLFTTEKMIAEKPDLVRRFVQATLKGWNYAIENQEEAVNLSLLYPDPNNKAQNFVHQAAILKKSIPLIKPTKGTKIGQMDFVRWKNTYDLMRQYGILKEDLDIRDAYTLNFLK